MIGSRAIEEGLCEPTLESVLELFCTNKEDFDDPEVLEFSADEYGYPGEFIRHAVMCKEPIDIDLLQDWWDDFMRLLGPSFTEAGVGPYGKSELSMGLDDFVGCVLLAGSDSGIDGVDPVIAMSAMNGLGVVLSNLSRSKQNASEIQINGRALTEFRDGFAGYTQRLARKKAKKHWDEISHLFEPELDNAYTRLVGSTTLNYL